MKDYTITGLCMTYIGFLSYVLYKKDKYYTEKLDKVLKQTEEKEDEMKYDFGKEGIVLLKKHKLFDRLSNILNYDQEKPELTNTIQRFKKILEKHMNDLIPTDFQELKNYLTEKQLYDIVYRKLHNDNIEFLLELLKHKDFEDFIELHKKNKENKKEEVYEIDEVVEEDTKTFLDYFKLK